MRHIFTLSVLVAVLFWTSCSNNVLRVTKFSPSGEVDNQQSFVFTFNQDVAPKKDMDKWLKGDYVQFEPKIEGRYKWVTPNTLIFSPSYGMSAGQSYKAYFNKEALLSDAPSSMQARFNTLSFKTPDFAVQKADIFWTPIEKTDFQLTTQANLHFNYKVDPKELREYLTVFRGNEEMKTFTIVTEKPDEVIALDFGKMKQSNEEQTFKITIRKGLNSILKKTPLQADIAYSVKLPPIQKLAISDATASMNDAQYIINVTTSQAIDVDKAAKFIEIEPKLGNQEIEVDNDKITITGDIPKANEVRIKVKKGMPGLYGGVLEEDYIDYVIAEDAEPILRFSDRKGMYLVKGGEENIKIETVNIPELEVEVQEVFQNNLLFFFANNYSYEKYRYSDYDENFNIENTDDYEARDYGQTIYKEEIKFPEIKNTFQYATINLHKAINQRFKGIYVVRIGSNDDYYRRDSKIISFSDIGLVAKRAGSEMLVFANSIKTTAALPGVTVSLVSSNNQTLLTATTDANGVAKFENLKESTKEFTPRLVSASLGDDFNFLDLEATGIETSRFDVGGKLVTTDTYDAFLYSDRNIYRPGETINLSGIVRDYAFGIVKDVPVLLKIVTPTGKVFNQYQKTLNEQGSFEQQIEVPDFSQTGQYVAELYTGNDKLLQSYRFNIEEFQPDKIRVMLDGPKKAAMGEEVKVDVKAEYLFGEPAKGHHYESDIVLSHRDFASSKFKDFNFAQNTYTKTSTSNESNEGELDAEGKATISYTVPEDLKTDGFMEGKAYVSVFDVTGRTVNRFVAFDIFPKDHFIGIKKKGSYFGVNQDINYQVIAVDPDEKVRKDFPVSVSLIHYEWKTVLTKTSNGRFEYKSQEESETVWERDMKIDGSAKDVAFKVDKAGKYQLRIAKEGEDAYVFQDFYAYNYGTSTASSFEINREGQIDIVMDKASYKPGETAKALFITPFTGKMLVTVEREKIYKHFYVNVDKNSVEVPIPLEDAYLPNVYISATIFKPHTLENQNIPLFVGHGFTSVSVEQPSTKIPITISAPEKVRPMTKQSITVKTDGKQDVYVTLAAVDEGILQVKNFKTPDPHGYMYGKRQLSVESFDMYELLLPEYKSISSAAGGDDYADGKRQNPIKSKRFKLVSLWSGIKKTDSNGEVKIDFEVPQYNGELRLMAVAYQGARFGSGDKPMKVYDDVIIMPAIPRSLTLGDSLSVPVSIMNTTDKAGEVKINMEVTGPLKITSSQSQSIQLEPNGTKNVFFGLNTTDDVGLATIKFTTSGLGKTQDVTEIAVRPAASFTTETGTNEINAGDNLDLDIPADYVPGTQNTRITASNFPALKNAKQLRYLLGYPHGCLEQTTSKLFPQLYFNDLAQVVAPEYMGKNNSAYFVRKGIDKIESMTNYDGRISYWQGQDDYHNWATVFASHFLVEAKKAGFEVDSYVYSTILGNLSKMQNEKTTEDYITYSETGRSITKIAPKSNIYALYVLALAGKSDISSMNYFRARPELLTTDTRYLLAGAFALSKNWNAYHELLPKTFGFEKTDRDELNFDSEIRANALMLNVLLDVDPTNTNIPTLVNYLAGKQKEAYSTQENAWLFLALGKAAGKRKDSNVEVEVYADGKLLKTLGKNESFSAESLNGKKISLKAKGTGSTYYFWSTEGTKKYAITKEEDKEFQVRRTYYDRKGVEIKGNDFKQGDLIVCKISINGGERSVPYVAVSDLVPSGFEIENPRLSQSTELKWATEDKLNFTPDHLDFRDDRLILFTTANAKVSKTYYYLMRVVNNGRFELPAISAEAMYNPDARSVYGARKVRVRNG